MNLTSEARPGHTMILHVEGDLDGATYGELLVETQQLLAYGVRYLVLDLTQCAYMSSAGLIVLTSIFKQMRDLTRNETGASWATKNALDRAGELGPARQLVLVNPSPPVERVITLAGMQSYIPIYASTELALASQSLPRSR